MSQLASQLASTLDLFDVPMSFRTITSSCGCYALLLCLLMWLCPELPSNLWLATQPLFCRQICQVMLHVVCWFLHLPILSGLIRIPNVWTIPPMNWLCALIYGSGIVRPLRSEAVRRHYHLFVRKLQLASSWATFMKTIS